MIRSRFRVLMLAAVPAALVAALVVASAGVARSQAAPTLVGEPTIFGVALVGRKLDANHGNWSGSAPINYKYQWLRCPRQSARPSRHPRPLIENTHRPAPEVGGPVTSQRERTPLLAELLE